MHCWGPSGRIQILGELIVNGTWWQIRGIVSLDQSTFTLFGNRIGAPPRFCSNLIICSIRPSWSFMISHQDEILPERNLDLYGPLPGAVHIYEDGVQMWSCQSLSHYISLYLINQLVVWFKPHGDGDQEIQEDLDLFGGSFSRRSSLRLHLCIKVTQEPPAGLKASLHRTYTTMISQETLDKVWNSLGALPAWNQRCLFFSGDIWGFSHSHGGTQNLWFIIYNGKSHES